MSLAISIHRSNLNARCFGRCTGRSPDSSTGSTVRDPGQAHLRPQGKPRTTAGTSRIARAAGAAAAARAAGTAKGRAAYERVVRLAALASAWPEAGEHGGVSVKPPFLYEHETHPLAQHAAQDTTPTLGGRGESRAWPATGSSRADTASMLEHDRPGVLPPRPRMCERCGRLRDVEAPVREGRAGLSARSAAPRASKVRGVRFSAAKKEACCLSQTRTCLRVERVVERVLS